jgi:hypothetical protein
MLYCMSTPEERRARSRKAYLTRWRGPDHPDTIKATRDLIEAQAKSAEAEAARLRGLLAGLPGAEPVGAGG